MLAAENFRNIVGWTLACVGLVIFRLACGFGPDAYLGFTRLDWEELVGCTVGALPENLIGRDAAVGTWNDPGGVRRGVCVSKPFPLESNVIKLEVAGYIADGDDALRSIHFLTSNSSTDLQPILRPATPHNASWTVLAFEFPEAVVGREVIVRFSDDIQRGKSGVNWLGVRSKVNFYQPSTALSAVTDKLTTFWGLVAVILITGFSLTWFVLKLAMGHGRRGVLIGAMLLISALWYYRAQVFFYWDEWGMLARYVKFGIAGAVYTHNEHFLPLFFSWFFLESKLFGDRYALFLLVSLVIHVVNVVLLRKLLILVGGAGRAVEVAAGIVSSMFLINALHSEVMQWSFEQSVLLSESFVLIALVAAYSFLIGGKKAQLAVVALGFLFSPFFFANAFGAVFTLFIVAAYFVVMNGLTYWRRAVALLLTAGSMLFICAVCYSLNRDAGGHGVSAARPFENLAEVARYIYVGSQLGTLLRGSGLNATLEPTIPVDLWQWCVLANLMVFGLSAIFHGWRRALSFWLLGQGIIVSTFVLPALGRWHFGAEQSLSLRYQYGALIGWAIMMLPLFSGVYQWFEHRVRLRACVLGLILTCFFVSHTFMAINLTYFTEKGLGNRQFVAELVHWERELERISPQATPYEGTGTALVGLYPIMPDTVTPDKHPREIYQILNYLSPESYPALR